MEKIGIIRSATPLTTTFLYQYKRKNLNRIPIINYIRSENRIAFSTAHPHSISMASTSSRHKLNRLIYSLFIIFILYIRLKKNAVREIHGQHYNPITLHI